jgi:hypothetical protein
MRRRNPMDEKKVKEIRRGLSCGYIHLLPAKEHLEYLLSLSPLREG